MKAVVFSFILSAADICEAYHSASLPSGFSRPTSLALDQNTGIVFIASQGGSIWRQKMFNGSSPTLVKSLSVFDFQWHGLSSLFLSQTHLYATYTSSTGESCKDDGTNASVRDKKNVLGCPRFGKLVRWGYNSISGDLSVDPPEDVFKTVTICSQFGSNGINQIIGGLLPGTFFVSTGVGANDAEGAGTDYGQYGERPCVPSNSAWGGHFSALDAKSGGGKIFLLDLTGSQIVTSLYASGFHNPWRMVLASVPPLNTPSLYAVDSGGAGESQDEVNGPIGPLSSYGWPCFLGTSVVSQFASLLFSPCTSSTLSKQSTPFFISPARAPGVPGVISALAWHPILQRWFAADALKGVVFSFPATASTESPQPTTTVHSNFTYAVQLLYVSPSTLKGVGGGENPSLGAMFAVDIGTGKIKEVPPIFLPATSGAGRPTLLALVSYTVFCLILVSIAA